MSEGAQIILKPPGVSTQIRRKSYRKRTQIVVVHSGPLMFPSRSKTSQESTKQRPKSSQKRVPETANGCLDPLRRDRRNTSEKRIDFVTVLTPTWRPRGTRNRQKTSKSELRKQDREKTPKKWRNGGPATLKNSGFALEVLPK